MKEFPEAPGEMPAWRVPATEDLRERFSWGGLTIATNAYWPRLPRAHGPPDLTVIWRLGHRPDLPAPIRRLSVRGENGDSAFTIAGNDEKRVFDIQGVAAYVIQRTSRTIEIFAATPENPREIERFLVNTALPMFAGVAENLVCLHASAVARDGQAIVFAGPSRVGKSTSAWRLVKEGWLLVGDDVAVVGRVSGAWGVLPSSRGLRLDEIDGSPTWKSGPKVERLVPATEDVSRIQSIVLLAPDRQASARPDIYSALLGLQHAWVWGGVETRQRIADATLRLLETTEVRVDDSGKG